MTAAQLWRDELAAWAIPADILAAAPESPWGFPVEAFPAEASPTVDSPSRACALEALASSGDVLDVGCGGGAASFALVPPARSVTGVDASPEMLQAYAAEAKRRHVEHREVVGNWPEVVGQVDVHDVVVCHHVFYNVAELPTFALALTAKARHRVVVEMTATHPLADTAPLWRHFHGVDRPTGPTADLAIDVLVEAGMRLSYERWQRPPRGIPREVLVAMNRRRLCLPKSAEPEVDRLMGDLARPREMVTMCWDD